MNTDGTGFKTCKEYHKIDAFDIVLIPDKRKEKNWKTEGTLERAVVTLGTERIKRSNP